MARGQAQSGLHSQNGIRSENSVRSDNSIRSENAVRSQGSIHTVSEIRSVSNERSVGEGVSAAGGEILVSVIMPVYNADKYLRQCLDDLVRQSLREIEIICVDDGSDDCSRTILSDYEKRYRNFRFVRQDHAGAARARNLGISMARGRYLSILDSDDRFEPDMLEKMYRRAEDRAADIVICGCDGFSDASGRTVPMMWALDHSLLPPDDPFSVDNIPSRIFSLSYGWAWDKLFRTDFIRGHGIRFQELPATNDMYFTFTALAEAKNITVLRRVLVHQRLAREGSISGSRHKNTDCFYYALLALRDRLVRGGIYEKTEQSFKNWAVSLCAWQLNTLTEHPEAFLELYNKLHSVILPEFGIGSANNAAGTESAASDSESASSAPERIASDSKRKASASERIMGSAENSIAVSETANSARVSDVYYLRKNRKAYRQCLEIAASTAEEYLYHRWQTSVKVRPKLLLRRTVDDSGLTELRPVFSGAVRRIRGFFQSLRIYGAGYTFRMLLGMIFGGRK